MALLAIYVVLTAAGQLFAVQLGLILDNAFPILAIPIALGLFFTVFVAMGPLSVLIHDRWVAKKA